MADPTSYPWVVFDRQLTSAIDSTPTVIFEQEYTAIIDSIFVTNTCNTDIFVDVKINTIVGEDSLYYWSIKYFPIKKNQTVDLLIDKSVLYLRAGDKLYANTDFSGNTCDSTVNFRKLLELGP